MENEYIKRLIDDEIVNTIGCTNIASFGYIGAIIAKYATGMLTGLKIDMSSLVYKNTVNVCIPYCGSHGLSLAVILGYLMDNSEKGLELFADMNEHILAIAKNMIPHIECELTHKMYDKYLYIQAIAYTTTETIKICIEDEYDNITLVERNNYVVFKRDADCDHMCNPKKFDKVENIVDFVNNCNINDFSKLFNYADMQYNRVDNLIMLRRGTCVLKDDILDLNEMCYPLHQYIYCASKTRMDGDMFQTYALAGSGNLGIGVFVSACFISKAVMVSDEVKKRAILLAFLLSVTYKFRTCVANAMCGSALATGFSSAAVACYISGGSTKQICDSINNYIAASFGVLCDGAKHTCGFKVANAAVTGVLSAKMALDNQVINEVNGINKPDVNETLSIIGQLNDSFISKINKGVIPVVDKK